MGELISRLGENIVPLGGILAGVVAIIGGFSVAIVQAVTAHRRRAQLDDMEATLKMEMIQRGMSAADIKAVLEAKLDASLEPAMSQEHDKFRSPKRHAKCKPWGSC